MFSLSLSLPLGGVRLFKFIYNLLENILIKSSYFLANKSIKTKKQKINKRAQKFQKYTCKNSKLSLKVVPIITFAIAKLKYTLYSKSKKLSITHKNAQIKQRINKNLLKISSLFSLNKMLKKQ